MENVIYIYTLADPRTGDIRYVGKTCNPKKRLSQTICDKGRTHKMNWVNSLTSICLSPVMEILEETSYLLSNSMEIYWISQLKTWGFKLLNATVGGEGILGAKLNLTIQDRASRAARSEKTVIQFNLSGLKIKRYNSLKEAVSMFGNEINRAVVGKRKTAYGFLWKYEKPFKRKDTIVHEKVREKRRLLIKKTHDINKRAIVVFDKQANKIATFSSIGDAAKEYSILLTAISNQLTGRSKSCNQKIFKYV